MPSNNRYHVILIPDIGSPTVTAYDSMDDVVTCLRKHIGTATRAYVIYGEKLGITKGPPKTLRNLAGTLVALEDYSPDDIDPDGNLWNEPKQQS